MTGACQKSQQSPELVCKENNNHLYPQEQI